MKGLTCEAPDSAPTPAGPMLTAPCVQGLVYDSLSGNTRSFAERVAGAAGLPCVPLQGYGGERALLLTYTFGRGQVPVSTEFFLAQHAERICGVVAGGSYHWGVNFGRAGHLIAQQHGIPLVATIDKRGSDADVEKVLNWLEGLTHATPQMD